MFAKFAQFISRYWIAVLIAWVVLPIGLKCIAPKWDDITHDGDFAYLPPNLTSVRGEELLEKAFPEFASKSNIVLVVARSDGRLSDEDKAVSLRLAKELTPAPGEKSPVASVMTYEKEIVGKKLVSRIGPNGQAVLVVLHLNSEIMAVENMPFMQSIYRKVADIQKEAGFPAGLQLGVTGSAAIGSDMLEASKESIENTELTTIILVVVILLVVYRVPGLLLVPLLSIAVSFIVSLDLIALVAQWADKHQDLLGKFGHLIGRQQFDFQVFTTTHIFIIVVLFGGATDYCLFLIARYREELEHGLEPRTALEEALGQTGHALIASAMTTILGLGAMIFADFGKYRSGGPTIAISLVVALLACMTVAPALLRAFGRAVLWEIPRKLIIVVGITAVVTAVLLHLIGHSTAVPIGWSVGIVLLERSAAIIALILLACLAAAASRGLMGRFWNWLAGGIVSHPGLILAGSFLVLAVPAWHGFNVPITYDMLAELNANRESVQGMRLLEKHFLIGETVPITILAYRSGGDFNSTEQREQIAVLTLELSNFQYPDSHGQTSHPIDAVRSLTNPLGDKPGAYSPFSRAGRERMIAANHPECKKVYLSGGEYAGEVTRFDLVSDYDPFSQESMRLLGAVDDWLKEKKSQPNSPWRDVEFDYVGVTAGIRDLDAVNRSDTFWIGPSFPYLGGVDVYVAVAVLVVLIFLLRRPLLSLYLIFTVVFGYLVSLGLTHLFFGWYYGATYQGLDWKLKIFLFVILVAVGEDYNIYLVTRVLEEQRRRGPLAGLHEAVVRTGGIITSCGVIMAGTFGSMATGTLRSMIELGFAMSLGVLLDTFIIRTVLVPAFLALLARWGVRSIAETRGDVAAPHFDAVSGDLVRTTK